MGRKLLFFRLTIFLFFFSLLVEEWKRGGGKMKEKIEEGIGKREQVRERRVVKSMDLEWGWNQTASQRIFLERESQQIHSSLTFFFLTDFFSTPDQFLFLVSSLSLSLYLGLNEEGEEAEGKETQALKLSSQLQLFPCVNESSCRFSFSLLSFFLFLSHTGIDEWIGGRMSGGRQKNGRRTCSEVVELYGRTSWGRKVSHFLLLLPSTFPWYTIVREISSLSQLILSNSVLSFISSVFCWYF